MITILICYIAGLAFVPVWLSCYKIKGKNA